VTVETAALDTITYPWQTRLPGWTITFLGARPGLRGVTYVDDRRIEIYVRPQDSVERTAWVVAHELGHAVDVTYNDPQDRAAWRAQRHSDAPWWPDDYARDFDTLAGDFAEAFAVAQTGGQSSSALGQPSAEDLALLDQLATR
jgi:hypothetical protein